MAGFVIAGGNGVVRHGIRTNEAHLFAVVVVVDLLCRLVSWGRDAIGTGLFLGSTSSDSDILRGGLCGQVVFSAATVPSTTASSTAASATILTAAIASASVSIASSARSLASAASR